MGGGKKKQKQRLPEEKKIWFKSVKAMADFCGGENENAFVFSAEQT